MICFFNLLSDPQTPEWGLKSAFKRFILFIPTVENVSLSPHSGVWGSYSKHII
jgi:hypothetical protein